MVCISPTELVFNNSLNTTKKNIILYLQFLGQCNVSASAVSLWSNAADLRVFYLQDNATLLEGNETMGSELKTIGTVLLDNARPQKIPEIFTKYVWTRMAEVGFSHLKLKSIPDVFNKSMPLLQSLELPHNNLAKPPDFPWYNSTLELPRELQRTVVSNHHYEFGTKVDPKNYRRFFVLDYNNIEDLSTHQFRGFLNKLSLKGNGLKNVGPKCFQNLFGINVIDLSENNLRQLPSVLFHGLDSLTDVRLNQNQISVIPNGIFQGLSQITRIDLDHNMLQKIPSGLFHRLKNLEIVHLEFNDITTIERGAFPADSSSLRHVYLQHNRLGFIPAWLFLQRNGGKVDLSHNLLAFQHLSHLLDDLNLDQFLYQHRETASSPQFKLQKNLKHLSLANNNFSTINIREFNKTKKITFEFLLLVYEVDMTGNPIECDCRIHTLVGWLRSLMRRNKRISQQNFQTWKCALPRDLSGKRILSVDEGHFKCKEDLQNCPALCTCYVLAVDGTVVIDCQGKNLTELPRHVPGGLIEMLLQNNYIREIPPHPYLENVTALYLSQNKIKRLNASTVRKLKRTTTLYIDSNKLSELPKTIESLNFTALALHHNFFPCDCTTRWMKYWLANKTSMIVDVEKVLCNSKNAQGKAIIRLPDEEFVCTNDKETDVSNDTKTQAKTFQIVAFSLGGLFVGTFIILILVYRYCGEIKVFMYTQFNWHPFDRLDDSDPSKIYDAFVSYSGRDHHWVVNTLQKQLENHQPPYKLCIHDREFVVGAPIQENIVNSVNQSKRMLMILSRSFLESEWCLLEFRAAHHKVLKERMNYLIIILFDDVDFAKLDDEMRLYMRTNTYLSVGNKWFWEKLFYAMPQSSNGELRQTHLSSTASNKGVESSTENVYELRETAIQ